MVRDELSVLSAFLTVAEEQPSRRILTLCPATDEGSR
jgi:hypothetical protein